VLMVKMSTGKNDKWVDTLVLGDIAKITEWIGEPTE